MKSMLKILFLTFPLTSFGIQAATVAIIDSGTDYKHQDLAAHIWHNPIDATENSVDEDGNNLIDDIRGWNFTENNNQVIDYSYLNTDTEDLKKFFEIQGKVLAGTATSEEQAWMESKKQDLFFLRRVIIFANFIHGTHVAGIASNDHQEIELIPIKIIPTEVKIPGMNEFINQHTKSLENAPDDIFRDTLLKFLLDQFAQTQTKMLVQVGQYVQEKKVDVANGSFGIAREQIEPVIRQILKNFLSEGEVVDENKVQEFTHYFMNSVLRQGRGLTETSPETLFVFAAGNSAADIDAHTVFPASLNAVNTMAVAATFGDRDLAKFSNYGQTTVDVAAPGVLINSTIPGNQSMRFSGTSQAAPFVAHVAAALKAINPALTPAELKTIIIGTVDKKSFLAGKVSSAGIVNQGRALLSASLTLTLPLEAAINQARLVVPNGVYDLPLKSLNQHSEQMIIDNLLPLPLFPKL